MWNKVLLVFFGGAVGAALREFLMLFVANGPYGFPMSIFVANLTAAFLIGLAASLALRGGPLDGSSKLFISTGIMGGLSTFSSWMWGAANLLRTPSDVMSGLMFLLVSMIAGFALVELGLWLGRLFVKPQAQLPAAGGEK